MGLDWIGLDLGAYGSVCDGAGGHFAGFGVDADGAGAVDCVVRDDGLGEDVWEVEVAC